MDLSTREGRREQGERIKQAARECGVTLDELARTIGCSRALIFQYASGASLPQSDRLQQIADVVKKPLYWFFLNADEQPSPGSTIGMAANLSGEIAKLELEREHVARERARFEQSRIHNEIGKLEALLVEAASPIDHRKIIDYCQQLQPLLAHSEDIRKRASVLLKQGNALIQLQEWGPAKDRLEQAASLYRTAEEQALARDCVQSVGHANLMLGRVEEAVKQFQTVADSDDWTNRWQGTLSLGAAYELLGKYPEAISSLEIAMAIVEEKETEPSSITDIPRLFVDANWANIELNYGDYKQALQRSQRCIRSAQRFGVQDQYIEALITAGTACEQLGQFASTVGYLQQAIDVSQLTGDRQHQSIALSCLSMYESQRKRSQTAVSAGKEALALALRSGALRAEVLAQRSLGVAYLAAGNAREAAYHIEQGLMVASSGHMLLPATQFQILRAKTLIETNELSAANLILQDALRTAIDLDIRPVQLSCHMELARSAFKTADYTACIEHATNAVSLSTIMQLTNDLWRSETYIVLANVRSANANSQDIAEVAASLLQIISNESSGDSCFMEEEPLAAELYLLHVSNILTEHGFEAAITAANQLDWPPIMDWLSNQSPDQGGTPNG